MHYACSHVCVGCIMLHTRAHHLSLACPLLDSLSLWCMQAACAPNTGEEDAWEDVLPERPFQPLPELHPRDVRVVLTTELKGVPTDARIVEAMTRFGAVLDAAGVEVHHSQGPAFDSRCCAECLVLVCYTV